MSAKVACATRLGTSPLGRATVPNLVSLQTDALVYSAIPPWCKNFLWGLVRASPRFCSPCERPVLYCAGDTMTRNQDLSLTFGELRRLKLFVDLTEDQIATFVSLVEPVEVTLGDTIVRIHELGNSMYLILNGEVQVSRTTGGRETVLAKLETGDFFGEMCLFDEAPRSANVVATRHCTLLRVTKHAFDSMVETHAVLAALFLRAMLRTVAGRLRTMDKKYVDSMLLSHFWPKESSSPAAHSRSATHPR
jgi:hypothetical protein